ncbi:N-acetyl-gamma-glutamyl-phosphate/N-acetyl-gamma-aminoadipyl-phosphate reductase [Striga asiatica]|uniref:N-acetyl-gamma-glutamyl-phosphate/N-acetyl-gamma-aminoadipyl-phosphate reductase n=1 Tax=Striga asiatica TaxID=4170 RepID=A0A5A7QXV5_STRAF|nr:N-acetyl-gamma-glutamyl-phosphate/N-acetyl-gamma-aminoadipyl-phosphate reductase [Striga asiatica]
MKEIMLLMNTLVAAQGTPGTQFITPMLQQSVLTGTIPTSRNTVNTSSVGKKPRKIDLHPERAVHINPTNIEATRLNPASPSGSQREGSTKLLGKSKKFKQELHPHVTTSFVDLIGSKKGRRGLDKARRTVLIRAEK